MPGRKLSFYVDFLKRGRSAFAGLERTEGDPRPCTVCGYPTSSRGVRRLPHPGEVVKSRDWEEALSGEGPPPNPPLSPKAFGLIESLFPVFRKVKAGARIGSGKIF